MSTTLKRMGKVTATITVTNRIDEILAQRGFIPPDEVRAVSIYDVLVDTGASHLCLPADIIKQLGLNLLGEIEGRSALGTRQVRLFEEVKISVEGREGKYDCVEVPEGADPLLGFLPLEGLGLEPDLENQRLRVLPNKGSQTYILL